MCHGYISLDPSGELVIYAGFAWDGPSGPTFDTKSFMRGSLVHDALYRLIRNRKIDPEWRKYADDLLYQICLEDGMWKWRASYVYQAVRKAGANSANPENRQKVMEAP